MDYSSVVVVVVVVVEVVVKRINLPLIIDIQIKYLSE